MATLGKQFRWKLVAATGAVASIAISAWLLSRRNPQAHQAALAAPEALNLPDRRSVSDSTKTVVRSAPPLIPRKETVQSVTKTPPSKPAETRLAETERSAPVPQNNILAPIDTHTVAADPDTQAANAPPVAIPDSATLTIGTRVQDAFLYIDGKLITKLSKRISIRLPSGLHKIQVTTEGCASPFVTTLTLGAGKEVNLNYVNPECNPQ